MSKLQIVRLGLLVALLVVKAYYIGRGSARAETWDECQAIHARAP